MKIWRESFNEVTFQSESFLSWKEGNYLLSLSSRVKQRVGDNSSEICFFFFKDRLSDVIKESFLIIIE